MLAVAAVLVTLVLVRSTQEVVPSALLPVVGLAGTAALLLLARTIHLSAADVGLARKDLRRGLRWAAVLVALTASVYAVLLLVPGGESLLSDDRTPTSFGAAATKALVTIPLHTVLLEEVGFRGVLWGALRRAAGTTKATVWSSVAFGLWHVPVAVTFARTNDATEDALGQSGPATVVVVLATVLFTGVAGVLLCEVRRRSGSLLAPIALHWATNGLGTLAAYTASTSN